MRLVRLLLMTAVLVVPGCARTTAVDQEDFDALALQRFYESIRSASVFASGHVGPVGTISDEEFALSIVLERPHAETKLRRLLTDATLPGQLYALWGLATINTSEFEKAAAKYEGHETHVQVMRGGCLVVSDSVCSIVKRIREGGYGRPQG